MGEKTLYTTRFALMGGAALIRFIDDRGRDRATGLARAAEAEALRIEWKFSRYREGSVVSEINRNAGRTPVAVDDETEALVEQALDLARLTGGRFDPTVGALRRAWDFSKGRVPTPDEIQELLPLVDHRAVAIREKTVLLRRPGMEIDLGGVGKEYAVDRVAELLAADGIAAALVNFAGDVRTVGGRGDGQPWSVGVIDPRAAGHVRFAVRFPGTAGVATSGDYERCFVRDGIRYHHILDATTGWPARGIASATVLARTAFAAGRLATAAFLLGVDEGLSLITSHGAEAALILDGGEVRSTEGMTRYSDLPGSLYHTYRGV